MDRSDTSAGLAFLVNGAKETRTPDPLHAMKILARLRSVATTSPNPSSTSALADQPLTCDNLLWQERAEIRLNFGKL